MVRSASMGPSMVIDGENLTCQLQQLYILGASMGPSMVIDGEIGLAPTVGAMSSALQWGRRWSSTERCCRVTMVSEWTVSFNGAVDGHRRRACENHSRANTQACFNGAVDGHRRRESGRRDGNGQSD